MQALALILTGFVASIAALSFGLPTMSTAMPLAAFYTRILLSFTCLLVCALYGMFASTALRVVGYGGLSQWTVARSFKWAMRWTVGVGFTIEGEEHLRTRPAVFIGNHQSELDVLLLGYMFPPYCSVTAKQSLKWIPFLGWFMYLSKTVFIDRGNSQNARLAFDSAARHMKSERQSVFIFPEGTRSYSTQPDLLPFKKGAFHLAIQAQVPVVPVVVANYSEVLHLQSKVFKSGSIPVKILPPISTKNMTAADVDDLTRRTQENMLAELVSFTKATRGQQAAIAAN